jgi:hypothetical protein
MKEHPILMTTESVNGILDSRKTQTRRMVKPQPTEAINDGSVYFGSSPRCRTYSDLANYCHYGQVGDRLWVRETWQQIKAGIVYKASWDSKPDWKWKPSIFMPRWASRITLEITGIRVERLQDITEEDAKAEGCVEHTRHVVAGLLVDPSIGRREHWSARVLYKSLWDSINGKKYPWSSNCWVWVIEFRRIKP